MRSRKLPIVLVVCLTSTALRAELSGDDYLGDGAIQDATERAQVQALINAERQREAERAETLARERAQEEAHREAERAAEAARRPQGEVLTQIHCGTCHAPEMLRTARYTGLGWTLTIARMRWLNGARIPDDDAVRIREHLARTQSAEPAWAVVEYSLAALFVLLPLAWALRRWSRRSAGLPRA
jgi:mono/diheme cytochrome c family protein